MRQPRDVRPKRHAAGLTGWLVVALSFAALSLVFASRASLGLMMPVWEQDPGWSRTFVSTVGALALTLMAVGSPLAGNLIDRHGPRVAYSGALLLVGFAVLAAAQASAPWVLLVSIGILGGIGNGGMSMPLVSAAVAGYFERRRGLATGFALAGGSGGQLLVMPALGVLLAAFGWRDTYLVFGLAILALAPLAWLLFRGHPPYATPAVRVIGDGFGDRVRGLLRDRIFLLLSACFFLCGLTTTGVVDVHFLPYASACGFPLVQSTLAYGVLGVGNLIGLTLFGWLADRTHAPFLLAAMFALRAALFVVLMNVAGDLPLLIAFAAVFGLINYATLPVVAAIVANTIGVRIMGLTLGLLFGGHALGGAVGAFFGGYLYDLFATYTIVWILALGLALLAAALALMIGGPEATRRRAAMAGI
ncbi:MAG TPA: MFS transporter [Alphaproteobacteria bacterium]